MASVVVLVVFGLLMVDVSRGRAASFSGSFGGVTNPRGIAVDEGSGDVYVVDESGGGSVRRFDANGVEVPFAVGGGKEPPAYVAGNALTGTPSGAFFFGGFLPAGVAVDNASGSPARGDVYVTDRFGEEGFEGESVAVYDPDGGFLGEVGGVGASPLAGGAVCGVAVDSAGDVYVAHFTGHVDKYAPVDGNPGHDVFVSQVESAFFSCGVAVDSTGAEYVQQFVFMGAGPVVKYPGGQVISEKGSGVAVNPVDDHLFIDELTQVRQLGIGGAPSSGMAPFGGAGELGFSTAVATDGSRNLDFAVDSSGVVVRFAAAARGPPIIERESVVGVTSSSVELSGKLNASLSAAKYVVEYGTDTSYGVGVAPVPGGVSAGEGEEGVAVQVQISALLASTTYHYRFVASNGLGVTTGEDHTFTTPANGSFVLPDGRAWEKVSPNEKSGGEIVGIDGVSAGGIVQATPEGNAITYVSLSAFLDPEGAPIASQYIAHREANHWSSENITSPTRQEEYSTAGRGGPYKAFSTDLASALQLKGDLPRPPGLSTSYRNYYLRDNTTNVFQSLLKSTPLEAGEEPYPSGQFELNLQAATPDLKHIVLSTQAVLTPGATFHGNDKENLYEWSNGTFQAINIAPGITNGATVEYSTAGGRGNYEFEKGIISEDGSRVFWTGGKVGAVPLFVREGIGTPQARTVELDASQGSGESGHGEFRTASADGKKAFFTDRHQLTEDSTAGGFEAREDLYEFDTEKGDLVDLTVDHNPEDPKGASVQGVLDGSHDGAYVYFTAAGALPKAQPNAQGQHPASGTVNLAENTVNLYVSHEGAIAFIATLSTATDGSDWTQKVSERTERVSEDGTHAVFMSSESLTGYDNAGFSEVYLYDATTGQLRCVSCNPSGAVPIGPSRIPGGTNLEIRNAIYQSRVLSSDSSRVFFDSSDALVSQDTNGRKDVYEYENGTPHLISGGTSDSDSTFADASASGKDVFFVTGQQLVPEDNDELFDLYDAREGGGITPAPTPPVCTGTGCQGPPSPPTIFSTPATNTFNGVGNYNPPTHNTHQNQETKKTTKHKTKHTTKHHKTTKHNNKKAKKAIKERS